MNRIKEGGIYYLTDKGSRLLLLSDKKEGEPVKIDLIEGDDDYSMVWGSWLNYPNRRVEFLRYQFKELFRNKK
jgi:hypothetical protein